MKIKFWSKDGAPTDDEAAPEPPSEVAAFSREELAKEATTDTVLVDPDMVGACVALAASRPRNEVGGLILGSRKGRYVLSEELVPFERVGKRAAIDYSPKDIDSALAKATKGQYIVGWFHSHPRYGVFLSSVDQRHQSQCQALDPDAVALVLDPLADDGIRFGFFRMAAGETVRVKHGFLERGTSDEA